MKLRLQMSQRYDIITNLTISLSVIKLKLMLYQPLLPTF
jgi:hypothetical protein